MGRPVAQHLMQRGHAMSVFARRAEAAAPLVAAGAEVRRTAADLAANCEVVFTMVTATPDVEHVLFGPHGVADGAQKGLLVIDMSTIAPLAAADFAGRLASRGVDMLDAPVSGGPEGARNGVLTVMVGGTVSAFERAHPLFECFGATILHMGQWGAGQATKACHQLLLLVTAEGVAEALALARRNGVDPALARQAMMAGIASSRVLDRFGGRMATRDFADGISLRLYRKDLQIVLDFARAAGAGTPAGELTMGHIQRLIDEGKGDLDLSALITALEPPQ